MKILINLTTIILLMSACSIRAPKPTMPKGPWTQMNTHIIKAPSTQNV